MAIYTNAINLNNTSSPTFQTLSLIGLKLGEFPTSQGIAEVTYQNLLDKGKSLFDFAGMPSEEFINMKFKSNNKHIFLGSKENLPWIYQYIGIYYENPNVTPYDKLLSETRKILESKFIDSLRDIYYLLSAFDQPRKKLLLEVDNIRNVLEVEDGVYVCSACSSSKTISSSKQMASADESSTIFVVCAACGHRWKTQG